VSSVFLSFGISHRIDEQNISYSPNLIHHRSTRGVHNFAEF